MHCGWFRRATPPRKLPGFCLSRALGSHADQALQREGPSGAGRPEERQWRKPAHSDAGSFAALSSASGSPPDGGVWSGPKIARWLADFHGLKSVHDQRGWDALVAIGYSIQKPRPRHPQAATEEDRAALKKTSRMRRPKAAPASAGRRRTMDDG